MKKVLSIILIIASVAIVTISFFDNIFSSTLLYSYEDRKNSAVTIFTVLVIISISCQSLIVVLLKLNKAFIIGFKEKAYDHYTKLIYISLAVNAIIFAWFLSDILFFKSYNLNLLLVSIFVNCIISVILVSTLIYKFLSWLTMNRSFSIIIFTISFVFFLLVIIASLLTIAFELENRSTKISAGPNPWDKTSSRNLIVFEIYKASLMIVFGLIWFGTSLLLKYYLTVRNKKLSKSFWIIVLLPFAYYVGSSDIIVNYLGDIISPSSSLYNPDLFIIGASTQVAGIYFGLSFLLMIKNTQNHKLRLSLSLSACGLMILFSSVQISIILLSPYPPFGVVTLSFLPLGSFIILIGLSYSAKLISEDGQFIKELREQLIFQRSQFLENIGSAEWKKNLEKTVDEIIKKNELGQKSYYTDLNPNEIRNHVDDVVKELEKQRGFKT